MKRKTILQALERADETLVDVRTHWKPVSHPNDEPGLCEALEFAVEQDHAAICDVLERAKISQARRSFIRRLLIDLAIVLVVCGAAWLWMDWYQRGGYEPPAYFIENLINSWRVK